MTDGPTSWMESDAQGDLTKLPDLPPGKHVYTVVVNAEDAGFMLHRGHARHFEVLCDEPPIVGGHNSAPAPLEYLALAVGF